MSTNNVNDTAVPVVDVTARVDEEEAGEAARLGAAGEMHDAPDDDGDASSPPSPAAVMLQDLHTARIHRSLTSPNAADLDKEYPFDGLGITVRIREVPGFSIGSHVWGGGFALAKYLEAAFFHARLDGKRVVELGAGTGLPSIVAALLGGDVVATDLEENVVLMETNIDLNCRLISDVCVRAQALSWGDEAAAAALTAEAPIDVIIAADVVYNADVFGALLSTLDALAGPETTVFLAMKDRAWVEGSFFEDAAAVFKSREVTNAFEGAAPDDSEAYDGVHIFEMCKTGFKRSFIKKLTHTAINSPRPHNPNRGYGQLWSLNALNTTTSRHETTRRLDEGADGGDELPIRSFVPQRSSSGRRVVPHTPSLQAMYDANDADAAAALQEAAAASAAGEGDA